MAAEAHVVHRGDPEPHGVGGDHGVKVLCQDVVLGTMGFRCTTVDHMYLFVMVSVRLGYDDPDAHGVGVNHGGV